jgi:16S rRNA processing protein RimM
MTPRGGWLRAGGVGKPHGLDGSFYVTDPKLQLLDAGRRVVLRGNDVVIAARKGSDRRPIVRLEGVSDREGAEAIRGEQLLVAREDAPALAVDEWWEEDLEGCTVLVGGRPVGVVKRLVALPSCEALEVEGIDALIPLIRNAVLTVDVERGEIEIDTGFLGLS